MERIRFALYGLAWQAKKQLKRVPFCTWVLLAILAADMAEPGYLKYNFLILRIDLSGVIDAYRSED